MRCGSGREWRERMKIPELETARLPAGRLFAKECVLPYRQCGQSNLEGQLPLCKTAGYRSAPGADTEIGDADVGGGQGQR